MADEKKVFEVTKHTDTESDVSSYCSSASFDMVNHSTVSHES